MLCSVMFACSNHPYSSERMANHVRIVSPNGGTLLQLLLGRVRRQLRLLTRARPIPFGLRRVRLYTCRGGRLRMDERACLRR